MSIQVETVLISGLVTIIAAILTVTTTLLIGRKQLKQNEDRFRQEQQQSQERFQQEQENKQNEFQQELEKFRYEQRKWITELKTAYETEIFKTRIVSYPKAFEIIGKLSHKVREPLTPEKANEIAYELNDWFYSNGGMCAETSTRGAILLLREVCSNWKKQGGNLPKDLYKWRNYSLLLLRNDLGIQGLESFNFKSTANLITRVKDEVDQATNTEHPT